MASNSVYGAVADEIADLFSDYLEGDGAHPALVLSCRLLDAVSRNAIVKSLESFGYSNQSCTFATVFPQYATEEGGDIALDPQALFNLVEGLDPLFLIATDHEAVSTLTKAYRIEMPAAEAASIRIFGRPAVAFKSLAGLLETESGKQRAWRALKSLNV